MAFQEIDMATWPRRDHFRHFLGLDHPFFGVTVEVDLTGWLPAVKARGLGVYPAMIHRVSAAANAVEAFRTRIRGEKVVVHDRVHPSCTVPWGDDLFNFCVVDYEEDAAAFSARARSAIAEVQAAPALLLDPPGRDDMIFVSCLPWLAFTGMTQVADARSGDSFPRIAWGKHVERAGRIVMPMHVQLHHAVADGRHIARFFEHLESGLSAQASAAASEGIRSIST